MKCNKDSKPGKKCYFACKRCYCRSEECDGHFFRFCHQLLNERRKLRPTCSCRAAKQTVMLSIFLFVIFSVNLASSADHGAVDCSMGSKSCNSCHAAYPFCYWCDGQCRKYYGKKIADIECTGEVMYESCPREGEKERLEKMLKLLESLKQAHKPHKASSSSLHQYWGNANGRYEFDIWSTTNWHGSVCCNSKQLQNE